MGRVGEYFARGVNVVRKVPVTAQLLAPVAIKRNRQSERSESVRSVGGTLIRGALAAIYLQHHGHEDDTFRRLFLNEESCRFGPLDPGPKHFPLTATTCKHEGIEHALVDQLWFRIAQHHMTGCVPENADAAWRQCAKCKADLKGHNGFWQQENDHLCEKSSDRHQVAAHVGIDRRTATAAESIFYTIEAMQPSGEENDLYGWLMADDDALDALKKLLEDEDHRISVGYHRTRGYGDLRLRLDEPIEKDDSRSRTEDWTGWSRDLIDFLGSPPLSVPDLDPEDFYFSLSFPTGAVFVDRFLRYTLDPADMISWLSPMTSVDAAFPMQIRPTRQLASGGTVCWITAITQHERLRGWNAAHGLPRQDEWIVTRGAVYVYRFQGTVTEREALIQQLATLSEDGVGLRRNEGFGTVIVSDNFHRRFCQQEVQP